MLSLTHFSSLGEVIVVALLYGFISGAFVALPPTYFGKPSLNRRHVERAWEHHGVITIGNWNGTLVSGAIQHNRRYNSIWIFAGVMFITRELCMMANNLFQGGWTILMHL